MRKLLLSIFIICSFLCEAAPGEPMPKTLGQGGAAVASGGIDAVFTNPAALGGDVLFLGSQSYNLSLAGNTFAFAKGSGGVGARILASTSEEWTSTDFLLWAGKSFSIDEHLKAGIGLSGFLSTGANLTGRGAMLDGGLLWQADGIGVGLLWRNLAAIESGESYHGTCRFKPNSQLALGLAWQGESLGAAVDLWPEGGKVRWQAGVSFLVASFQLRLGCDGQVPSLGFSFSAGERMIEYSWRGGLVPVGYLGLKFIL